MDGRATANSEREREFTFATFTFTKNGIFDRSASICNNKDSAIKMQETARYNTYLGNPSVILRFSIYVSITSLSTQVTVRPAA